MPKPSATRIDPDGRPPRTRSRVTNGSSLFVEGSGNSAWSRRYRDLVVAHTSDLGGPSELSEAQLSLLRRCAALEVELEQQEGRLSRGEQVNLDEYGRAASHLRRLFEVVGIARVPRDVSADDRRLYEKFLEAYNEASP